MFKKFILSFIIGFLALSTFQSANADVSTRIKVDDAFINNRNIVVTHPVTNEQYLLYLGKGCGQMKVKQSVYLVLNGELDGNSDYIKSDAYHYCDIKKADAFNQKLFVNYTYISNDEARVMDEKGQEYYMDFDYRCSSIRRYEGYYIYAYVYNSELSASDRILLPDMDGECSTYNVRKIQRKAKVVQQKKDAAPGMAGNVRTVPMNGSVALYWSRAYDDIGISHYVISYNKYYFDSKEVPYADMPNKVSTNSTTTYFTISGLENDQYYFFRIVAVDTSGNVSSTWSSAVMAMPRSAYSY